MTLIAGFKTAEGVVICADSQETLGLPLPNQGYAEYRVSVDKIEPQRVGNYDVVIGGAGYGPLVDGFTEALTDQIGTWDEGLTGPEIKSGLRSVVMEYHRNEVALCPVEDKEIHFLICLKQKDDVDAEIHLWAVRSTAIKRVKTYALIGWEEGIYRHDIERHYKTNQGSLYSMLLGAHLMLLAHKTSNNVGPPTRIVVANSLGIQSIAADAVSEMNNRVSDLDSVIDNIRLRLCDSTIALDDFSNDMSNFQTTVVNLRLSLTINTIRAKFARFTNLKGREIKSIEEVLSLWDPSVSLPGVEECTRALRFAWTQVTATRRSRRDVAIATHHLSHASRLAVQVVGVLYSHDVLSLETKNDLCSRLIVINTAGGRAIDRLEGLLKSGSISPEQATSMYAELTEEIVEPLLAISSELGLAVATQSDEANQVVQGLHAVFLTIFTAGFVQPFSSGLEPSDMEQLGNATGQLDS